MRTGELATLADVNAQTLRYYERRGLLEKPRRTTSGYRQYGGEAVRLIRFIKRAQGLGFTLQEVEELLLLRGGGSASCAEVREAASSKMRAVEEKIAGLHAMKQALATLIASCGRKRSARRCPILESLEEVPTDAPSLEPTA